MAADPVDKEDESEGGPVKSFLEHLEDFRWVLIKSLVTLGLAMLVCLAGGNYVVKILRWPLTHAPMHFGGTNQIAIVSFGTNHLGNFQLSPEQQKMADLGTNRFVSVEIEPITLGTNQILGWRVTNDAQAIAAAQRMDVNLINLSPAAGFFVAFQVAFYAGIVLAGPFIFYFVASFVFPALKFRERKYVYRAVLIGGGLFVAGVSFCYFVLMPLALAASQMYSNWLGFGAFQWQAEDYISFVCRFMLGMGIGFELPVVLLTLVKLGILSYRSLRGMWRYMVVINLILGALLTSPEVFTQITMAIPLYLLYEATVWVAWYWDQPDRNKARRTLWLGLAILLALATLLWMAWEYAWPRMHWRWGLS
ncbi:MAG TPA: twin-arginine translocase subunit TatC [Verrucomicrobiae bacterium]|nr:twin-arginine translocase subunit TatC [Verrucomicrobiae bacterium]